MKVIPTTAALPVEFIPPTQDHERYEREQTKALQLRAAALKRDSVIFTPEQIEAEQSAIDQQRAIMENTLETMRRRFPVPQVFLISVATATDRDRVNSRLISLGLSQASQEVIQATMIEELFNESWGGNDVGTAENDAIAEEHANFLDGIWQRQDAHNAAVEAWKEQEVERLLDHAHGAALREGEPPIAKIITVREAAKLQRLIDHMMTRNQALRDLAASNVDYSRRNHLIIVQMHVVGIVGFDVGVPIVPDPRTKALSGEAATALREKMDDMSWQDLYLFIDRMYRLDGGEEKNSDSPLEKPNDLNGSIGPSGASETSDGISKGSSFTPLPVDESVTITAPSSTLGFDAGPGSRVVSDTQTGDQ